MSKFSPDTEVPSFAGKIVCAKCEARGQRIDVRPNWKEQPTTESLSGETMAMIYVDFAVCSIGVISSVVAAVLLFYASHIKVPDNQDTFIGEVQQISRWNARAAVAFGIAALCAAYIFAQFLELVPFLLGT